MDYAWLSVFLFVISGFIMFVLPDILKVLLPFTNGPVLEEKGKLYVVDK